MIYDINTNNISFLKMSNYLHEHGVENNKFMLELYDESLVGVDPYDPNLSNDTKVRIYVEICKNFWYYIREVARVPGTGALDGDPFSLHLGNMAALYCCINNLNHVLILPRQVGKTVAEVTFSTWINLFSGSYVDERYVHKNESGAKENLARFKKYRELLPQWLQEMCTDSNKDTDNATLKRNSRLHNEIMAMSSANNDVSADKLGRGASTALVYYDEFAFLERNEIIWNAMIPAWKTSAEVAKRNGANYGIRITTTPNNMSLPQARYCYDTKINGAYKFNLKLYDIPKDRLESYIDLNSDNNLVYIYYSWKELGKTQQWYDDLAKTSSRLNVLRELDCVWPAASEGNVFTADELTLIHNYIKPPVLTLNIHGYDINFFEHPDFTMNYIVSCDVSGGMSQDRSVLLVIHPQDFHIVGLFCNSKIDVEDFKVVIFDLMKNYLIHSVVNVENNPIGLGIVNALSKDVMLESRTYRETVERQAERVVNAVNGRSIKQKTKRIMYGTNTNSSSRKLMFELLPSIVRDEPEVFVSEDFYNEIANLIYNKGRPEARAGYHDDIIMAYLITRYALVYGQCFKNVFHISAISSPSNVRNGEGISDPLQNLDTVLNYMNAGNYMSVNTNDDPIINYINNMNNSSGLQGYMTEAEKQKNAEQEAYDFISRMNRGY